MEQQEFLRELAADTSFASASQYIWSVKAAYGHYKGYAAKPDDDADKGSTKQEVIRTCNELARAFEIEFPRNDAERNAQLLEFAKNIDIYVPDNILTFRPSPELY